MAVNVWGADHHGHVHRLKMALRAAGMNPESLESCADADGMSDARRRTHQAFSVTVKLLHCGSD